MTKPDEASAPIAAATVFLGLAGLALCLGLAEAGVLGLRRVMTGRLVWVGPRIVWMAPLGYLLLTLAPAAVLACLARLRPRQSHAVLAVGVGGLLVAGAFGLLRIIGEQRIHPAAAALVGLGLAVQVSRMLPRSPGRLGAWASRVFVRAALTVTALGLGVEATRLVRSAGPGGGGTLAGSVPNVLLVILDTVRAAELGLYGYRHPTTPRLDSIARHAVVFDNAFSTSSWTLPSHASMFTGRSPHEVDADWQWPLESGPPTVAEILSARGFRTGGFTANLAYTTVESGLADGFQQYNDYPLNLRELFYSTEFGQYIGKGRARVILRRHARKPASVVTAEFLRWQARDSSRPFFAFLNYFEAHIPYLAPDSLLAKFAGATGVPMKDRYDAAIAHLDAHVGSLLSELSRRGVLERTVVIITSDHGEQFGTRGLWDHGNSLYSTVVRVPLIVLLPKGRAAGLRVSQPVTLRNLARTMLVAAGQKESAGIPGVSLSRFWEVPDPTLLEQDVAVLSELSPSPRVPANHRNARGEVRSLVRDRWHFIVNRDWSTELYDYWSDPDERINLGGVPNGSSEALSLMRNRMRVIDSMFPRIVQMEP